MRIDNLLPLGSIVLLHGGEKRLMIVGQRILSRSCFKKREYDYTGLIYPEGFVSTKEFYVFDHDDIEKVFFVGYEDEERKEFLGKLKELYEKNGLL